MAEDSAAKKSPLRRWILRSLAIGGTLAAAASGILLVDAWPAFGASAEGESRARMEASQQWDGSGFENPQPLWNDIAGSFARMLDASDYLDPDGPVAMQSVDASMFDKAPRSGLRVTWLGHSTVILEIDGHRILTDPVWGPRAAPWTWLGPARYYEPPLALRDLPKLDAVLISHDHYDHLDMPTMQAMAGLDTTFIVPLGVKAHLESWGVPSAKIVELDWWESHELEGHKKSNGVQRARPLIVHCTPARHASGRSLWDRNATLWAGYALQGKRNRVFFSGDTGLFPDLKEIGERYGPFDLTMIESGAYDRAWPDWHMGPEQAIEAHQWTQGKLLMPIHWGLFSLALHGWTEPVERVLKAAEAAEVPVVVPRPGQSFEPKRAPELERWWPEIPWQTAAEHPVRATGLN